MNVLLSVFIFMLCLSHYAYSQQFALLGTAGEGTCDNSPAMQRSLYNVNPGTGQMQFIGTPGFNGMTSMAYIDDGRLVVAGFQDNDTSILVEIDPVTGQGTLIGIIGNRNNPGECARIPGMTYDSATDTLYALARKCNDNDGILATINPDTAEMTPIGELDFDGGGFGLAIRNDGTLFASVWNNEIFSLYTLNKNTGASTLVGTMNTSGITTGPLGVGGLAFDPITQQLYASANNGDFGTDSYLLTVNESAPPSFNVVGQTEDCFDGIVFAKRAASNVPTLSEWGLIAMAGILGLVGFMVVRRRKAVA